MMNWQRYLIASVGTGFVMSALSLAGAGRAIAEPIKTTMALIVNGTDQPVPVKHVGPLEVQTAGDGSKEVFAREAPIGWTSGATQSCSNPIQIPDGKRVVVEYISVFTRLVGADSLFDLHVRPTAPGDNRILATVSPVFGGTGGGGGPVYTGNQQMRLYLDTDFVICGDKATATNPAFFSAMVWGYLVDRP